MTEQTWFKTGGWRELIEPVCVVKVTAKTVTVREKRFTIGAESDKYDDMRRDKHGLYERFFPTWEEAHAYLLERTESKLKNARNTIEESSKKLDKIKGMKPPKP